MAYYVGFVNDDLVGCGTSEADLVTDTRYALDNHSIDRDDIRIVEATKALYDAVMLGGSKIDYVEIEGGLLDFSWCLCDKCSNRRHLRFRKSIGKDD